MLTRSSPLSKQQFHTASGLRETDRIERERERDNYYDDDDDDDDAAHTVRVFTRLEERSRGEEERGENWSSNAQPFSNGARFVSLFSFLSHQLEMNDEIKTVP